MSTSFRFACSPVALRYLPIFEVAGIVAGSGFCDIEIFHYQNSDFHQ